MKMEEIKVYNTLTGEKTVFRPLVPGEVKIYVCGVTPYNHPHIGNARPAVTWDVICRYLRHIGYKVEFVQNFTDVDDKIINKANAEGADWKTISDRYIDAYFQVMDAMHVRRADVYPRVSDHMQDIIDMVQGLIDKGHAYVLGNDVYYDISTFEHYGALSGRKIDDMLAGARIEVNEGKRNPGDFALWKGAKPGEPFWESPWGKGRPGWHIECSAMSVHYLGKTFDFHGGGSDLIFPHHENEIAQSECCTGKEYAHYWMHNGYINVDNKKMSKSLGNFFTVREVAEKYGYEPIKYMMLSAHYRSPINYNLTIIEQCKAALERLHNCRDNLDFAIKNALPETADAAADEAFKQQVDSRKAQFIEAMDDDLNTADGIAAVFDLVRDINTFIAVPRAKEALSYASEMFDRLVTDVLGLLYERKEDNLDAEIEALIEQRQQARKEKNFALADKIRDDLKARGIVLLDTPQGVKWKMEN